MAITQLFDLSLPSLLGTLVAAYVVAGVFYRLYLHPLHNIPGPKLAAATWWYEVYHDVYRPGLYNFRIQELHKRYGPILRINPEEVIIADREYIDTLYGPRKRNKLADPSLDIKGSVAGTADYELHRKRRQAMIGFFSPAAVRQLEPLLSKKRDILLSMIESNLHGSKDEDKQPINLSDLYFAYCWDIIQEYCFAFKSDSLSDPAESHKLRVNSNDLLQIVNFSRHFAWFNTLVGLLPMTIRSRFAYPGIEDLKKIAIRVRKNVDEVLADEKTTREEVEQVKQHRSIFYTLRDEPSLPQSEKDPLRLQREGWFLVVAGSESPARSLAIIHFHILNTPECLETLREELRPLGPSPQLKDLEQLPYLNACITEGNRLSFGLTRRMYRTAPEDTLVYDRYRIPPGTPVAITSLAVMTDEEIFPDPWSFKPERWLGPGARELRKYHCSFGFRNPRACLGVHLAEAEMRLAIAGVVKYDMNLYKTTADDVAYKHDFQVAHGRLKSQGVRAIVTDKAEGL